MQPDHGRRQGALTAEQLDHFRRKLAAALADVDVRIAAARERALEPTIDEPVDRGDDAVRDTLIDTSLEVGEIDTHQREEINDALLRIELGDYGVCEACGEPIALERLEAVPWTRFCSEDAERRDVRRPPTL
jgi:RNA polymerase-binding transcription factor DksA